MRSITLRNIPNEIIDVAKILATLEKRSLNNELLLLIEKGIINHKAQTKTTDDHLLSKEAQIQMWKEFLGAWKDSRSTKKIIQDIYESRTPGREFDL